jgi:hypothetical protein
LPKPHPIQKLINQQIIEEHQQHQTLKQILFPEIKQDEFKNRDNKCSSDGF